MQLEKTKKIQDGVIAINKNTPGTELLQESQEIIVFSDSIKPELYYKRPYLTTTQNQRYLEKVLPQNVKNACCILGAGDTVIELQSRGIEDITALELNPLQTLVYHLKNASLLTLSNSEFESFLLDISGKDFLSYDIYKTVREAFSSDQIEEKNYWDIFLELNPKEDILNFYFKGGMERTDLFKIRTALPYIKRKKNYYKAREIAEKTKVDIYTGDAFDYFENLQKKSFDYIDFTNILLFIYQIQCNNDLEKFGKYVNVVKQIYDNNLNEDGIFTLDYMFKTIPQQLNDLSELSKEQEQIRSIYNDTYQKLGELFNIENGTVESLSPSFRFEGAQDSVVFVKKRK